MNCAETRRHWHLYHDSEGDSELHFQINEHLESCAACRGWFAAESRLEDLITGSLAAGGRSPELWARISLRSGLAPRGPLRRWVAFGAMLSVAAGLLLAVLLFRWGPSDTSLSALTAARHASVLEGRSEVEFASNSDIEVEQYLKQRVAFPVRCPPRADSGFAVAGAGVCRFGDEEAAFLVGAVDGSAVSIFILSRDSLAHFPHQREALAREAVHRCREGNYEMVMAEIDRNVVLVVGDATPEHLQRVLTAYGTYPEPHHG